MILTWHKILFLFKFDLYIPTEAGTVPAQTFGGVGRGQGASPGSWLTCGSTCLPSQFMRCFTLLVSKGCINRIWTAKVSSALEVVQLCTLICYINSGLRGGDEVNLLIWWRKAGS